MGLLHHIRPLGEGGPDEDWDIMPCSSGHASLLESAVEPGQMGVRRRRRQSAFARMTHLNLYRSLDTKSRPPPICAYRLIQLRLTSGRSCCRGTASYADEATSRGLPMNDTVPPESPFRPRARAETIRTASLTPRLVRDLVPPRISRLLLLQAIVLVALVGAGAATASPDARFRALINDAGDPSAPCSGVPSFTLVPGMFYGNQILGSLAIGTVACAWALRRIAHRPGDDQQRRTRSRVVTAGWGVLVSGQLLVVLLTLATWHMYPNCSGVLGNISYFLIYPMGLLALVTLAWSLFTLVVPRAVRR